MKWQCNPAYEIAHLPPSICFRRVEAAIQIKKIRQNRARPCSYLKPLTASLLYNSHLRDTISLSIFKLFVVRNAAGNIDSLYVVL